MCNWLFFLCHFLLPNLWLIHTARERDLDWYRKRDCHNRKPGLCPGLNLSHTARERDRYRTRNQDQWVPICHAKMFTLVQDRNRDQDPLFPIVPLLFPVPVPVPVLSSVIKSLNHDEHFCMLLYFPFDPPIGLSPILVQCEYDVENLEVIYCD